jgi:hypothetical protein
MCTCIWLRSEHLKLPFTVFLKWILKLIWNLKVTALVFWMISWWPACSQLVYNIGTCKTLMKAFCIFKEEYSIFKYKSLYLDLIIYSHYQTFMRECNFLIGLVSARRHHGWRAQEEILKFEFPRSPENCLSEVFLPPFSKHKPYVFML